MSKETEKNTDTKIYCHFCQKSHESDERVFFRADKYSDIFICDKCVINAAKALEQAKDNYDEIEKSILSSEEKVNYPSDFKAYFDDYIINQDKAKIILAVAMYNHAKKISHNTSNKDHDMKLKKSNILMVGPSGSGKTLFIETIARKLNLPFAICDATTFTEAGYVGSDAEIALKRLIENADGDIKAAEKGIIFLDEIDKIGRKSENVSITRDVSGEGVQQALLKMLDGSVVDVPQNGTRKHPAAECHKIDTSDILFICGGAFEGIDKIIKKRINKKQKISITQMGNEDIKEQTFNDVIHKVNAKDLRKFGLMPELLGRLPVICTLEELDKDALVNILTEPKDAITKQYKELFKMDGIELEFTKECLYAIADKASESGIGARALRSVMEDFMTLHMYKTPEIKNLKKITLTDECANNNGEPIYKYI